MLRIAPVGAGAGIVTKDDADRLLIVTLSHVVAGRSEVEFLLRGSDNWRRGQVSYEHLSEDFALVTTDLPASEWSVTSPFLCMNGEVATKALVSADLTHVGYSDSPWTESLTGGSYRSHDDRWIAFTSEDFFPGQSGGPLVNDVWQIVGLGVGRANGLEQRALRIDYVMALLDEAAPGATLFTLGLSSDEVATRTEQGRLSERLATMLNEYFYRARDLLITMEAGRITNASVDPTFEHRVQAYNLAHDALVNRRAQLQRQIASTFDEGRQSDFANVYAQIRGESDDPMQWVIGEPGVHSAVFQGLDVSISRHNSEGAKGMVPRLYYEKQLVAAQALMPALRDAIDSFLVDIENEGDS